MINDSMARMSRSFTSLEASFANIEKLIDDKSTRFSQDVSIPSLSSAPPHPPIQPTPSQSQSDPSLVRPDGHLRKCRTEPVESEGGGEGLLSLL